MAVIRAVAPKRIKPSRREAILIAVEALIRDTRATDFSMLVLAKHAGVSPATPYNVFGTKASILYVLLNQSLDGIFTKFAQSDNAKQPHAVVLAAANAAATFFIEDPEFYRPLYQHLIGVSDRVHRPHYMQRALQYWRTALSPLCDAGRISDDAERDTIARAIMINFVGTLDLWVQRELDAKQFHAHIMYGVSSILLGCADDRARTDLKKALRVFLKMMPRQFSFERAGRRR